LKKKAISAADDRFSVLYTHRKSSRWMHEIGLAASKKNAHVLHGSFAAHL